MARNNYYGNNYSPHFFLDGSVDAGYQTGNWDNLIDSELLSASPLEIEIGGNYSRSTRTGQAHIRLIATSPVSYTNLRLRIGVIESSIRLSSPNGTLTHNQTFRDMVPNTTGIAVTIAEGDTIEFTQSFSCPSPLVESNCQLFAFVQSDNSPKRILQGAKTSILSLAYQLNDFHLISPLNFDSLNHCNPQFIWHASADPDSGYPISYQVLISRTTSFTTPFAVSDTLSDTTWTIPLCLPEDSTFYWKVVAFNGHAPERSSLDVFRFTIDEFEPYFLDPFSLISPGEGDTVETCFPTFFWHPSLDSDSGYAVSYLVYISTSPAFDNPILSEILSDTTWVSPLCLPETTWHWKVVASNGHTPDQNSNETFSFIIDEPPTGCVYIIGDINNNGITNGIDVTYGVIYFKGGASPPMDCGEPVGPCSLASPFYAAGDVNGNCVFNGIDITFFVGYLKSGGGGELFACPACPPAVR